MFEHLTNGFEEYRNKVINLNKKIYKIDTLMRSGSAKFYSEESKRQILKEFLVLQEELNNLYRIEVSY